MPTLHLIDADSTQACPAVMSSVRAAMAKGEKTDTLLVLGGGPIGTAARRAGIERFDRIAVPFGKAVLGLASVSRWAKARPTFDTVHCWSTGALFAAVRVFKEASFRLSLAHTPGCSTLKRLRRLKHSKRGGDLMVIADNPVLADRLASAGVRCRTTALPLCDGPGSVLLPEDRQAVRRGWGVDGSDGLAVCLLSDHPTLGDSAKAALTVALAAATLQEAAGLGVEVALLLHPMQLNRRRAGAMFRLQAERLHVVQDVRVAEPWSVLGACDAALALGPDAGGLSLRWALGSGVPVIAAADGPAGQIDDATGNLHLSPSGHQKDLAHALRGVLSDVRRSV